MRLIQGIVLTAILALLSACNTVGGLGEDVQTGGAAITGTAQDAEEQL